MSKILVEARKRDRRFEVENWNMSKVGNTYTLTLTFKVVGDKGGEALVAGPAAALTPIVVKGLLVLAVGVLGIVGLSFVLKITYAVVELVEVLPYIVFPVGLYFLWRMMQEEQKRGSG